MTSNAAAGNRIVGTLRTADGKGVVRMEDRFDTDIADLWSALTDPGRLARWLGEFEGDLRLGGEFRARFIASGWEGTGRVVACEPPRRLLLLKERERGRRLTLMLPDLGTEQKNHKLDTLLSEFAEKVARLIEDS